MRLVDEIPVKLLDAAEAQITAWPEAFARIGRAVRVDYSTTIHSEDRETLRCFAHEFCSGVDVFAPSLDGETPWKVEEPYAPIVMGAVDRIIVATIVGEEERLIAYERAGVADPIGEAGAQIFDLEPALLCWDPENKQLVALTTAGSPVAVFSGGFLGLDEEAMIVG